MRVQIKNKAFAYRVPIGDYNYLQCSVGCLHYGNTGCRVFKPGYKVKKVFAYLNQHKNSMEIVEF